MRVSTRVRYAFRALSYIAAHQEDGPVTRHDIAESQGISDNFLRNILVELRAAGIVKSLRGVRGGYALTRPPGTISLLSIVESLEGPLKPLSCLMDDSVCRRTRHCKARQAWKKVNATMIQAYEQVSVKDICEKAC